MKRNCTVPVAKIWYSHDMAHFSDDTGRSWRHLAMRDKHTHYIGYNHVDVMDQTLTEQCHDLVCVSTLYPKVGIARRPAFITFKDPEVAKYVLFEQ